MLLDGDGQRKYVCLGEWRRFLEAAARMDLASRTFCYLLALTGCRISEALAVTPRRLDHETGRVVFRSLKRRKCVYRAVPVPPELMRLLRQQARGRAPTAPLWGWCRQTGWHRVKQAMFAAGISGTQATAKGLRHGFCMAAAEEGVHPATTQRWAGHARLETTAIYTYAVGREERAFARRIWGRAPKLS
jgi:integrase/recombinase XerD